METFSQHNVHTHTCNMPLRFLLFLPSILPAIAVGELNVVGFPQTGYSSRLPAQFLLCMLLTLVLIKVFIGLIIFTLSSFTLLS